MYEKIHESNDVALHGNPSQKHVAVFLQLTSEVNHQRLWILGLEVQKHINQRVYSPKAFLVDFLNWRGLREFGPRWNSFTSADVLWSQKTFSQVTENPFSVRGKERGERRGGGAHLRWLAFTGSAVPVTIVSLLHKFSFHFRKNHSYETSGLDYSENALVNSGHTL